MKTEERRDGEGARGGKRKEERSGRKGRSQAHACKQQVTAREERSVEEGRTKGERSLLIGRNLAPKKSNNGRKDLRRRKEKPATNKKG